MDKSSLKNVVVVSDIHAGCQTGLYPCDRKLKLDEGGVYSPSPFQRKLWHHWIEFWNDFIPSILEKQDYAVVFNGDALDGVHHGSVTQVTHNLNDQIKIAYNILKPVVDKAKGNYYHIRGTEAHSGKSGQYEELLATMLNAVPTQRGQYARNELWLKVGDGVIHFLHHIGTTSSVSYESTALMKELSECFVEAARWNRKPPSLIVRSHRHRFCEVAIPSKYGKVRCIVTPAWQGKTPFVWKVAGARLSTPMVGGIVIKWCDITKTYLVFEKIWSVDVS